MFLLIEPYAPHRQSKRSNVLHFLKEDSWNVEVQKSVGLQSVIAKLKTLTFKQYFSLYFCSRLILFNLKPAVVTIG